MFSMPEIQTLRDAHANFDDMSFDVEPAKNIVKNKVGMVFPGDKFEVLKMLRLGDGIVYMAKTKDNANTGFWYVVDNYGVRYRVETEAECVGFAPDTTCSLFLEIMGMGAYPAKIERF
jgi:hypothetical protein